MLLVDWPDVVRRQAVPWGAKATRAVVVLAALVAMLGSGQVPPAIAGPGRPPSRWCSPGWSRSPQAYRAVSWQTVVLVGALIPLSTAIQTSGAADEVASLIIDAVGDSQPYLLLVALFVLTATLGQVVSNTATVLVVVPDRHRRGRATGTSATALLMVVAIAGAAALLTPIATPGNMMIMSPGGYRFGDYWKLGLPIMGWWFVVALRWCRWSGRREPAWQRAAWKPRPDARTSSAPATATRKRRGALDRVLQRPLLGRSRRRPTSTSSR